MRTLALLALPLALLAEDAAPRASRLRVAWWDPPANNAQPVLTLAPVGAKPREFSPQVMNFGTEARCLGETAEFLVRRVERDPKTGKETVRWDPFASTPLPAGDDTLGVIMVADALGRQAQCRAFHLGDAGFPLGTVRLVNLTNRGMELSLDGKGLRVAAGGIGTHPRAFAKPEVAEVGVRAVVNGEARPVFSTKGEFANTFRLALFIVETPGTNPPQFEVRTVVDFPQPETPGKPGADESAGKAKSSAAAAEHGARGR